MKYRIYCKRLGFGRGIPDIQELVDDPHVNQRGAIFNQNHPAAGDISVYRAPWKSALTAKNPPAPLLGEQNEYVFKTLLGMSDEKIGEYIEKGIIN